MPGGNLDFVINVLLELDRGGADSVNRYLQQLEQHGFKWNQGAGQFQEVRSITGGSGFVSQADVAQTLREMVQQENERAAAARRVLEAKQAEYDMNVRNLELGKRIIQLAADQRRSVEEVIQNSPAGGLGATGMVDFNDPNAPMGRRSSQAMLADARAAYEEGFRPIQSAAEGTAQATGNMAKNMDQTRKYMADLRAGFLGFQLMMTGMAVQRAGQSVLSPISAYADFAGMAEGPSREWAQSMREIEQASLRVGRVMATELLPTMEEIADLADRIADFVEENPGVAKAAVGFGAGAVGLGGTLMAAGQMWSGIFAFRQLFGMLMAALSAPAAGAAGAAAGAATSLGGAAVPWAAGASASTIGASLGASGTMAGGAAAGTVAGMSASALFGVIVSAIVAGFAQGKIIDTIFDAASRKLGISREDKTPEGMLKQTGMDVFEQFGPAAIFGPSAIAITGSFQSWERFSESGALDNIAAGLESLAEKAGLIDEEVADAPEEVVLAAGALEAYWAAAEEDAKAATEYAEEVARAEKDYAEQRAKSVEDYVRQMAQDEADYMRERASYVQEGLKAIARAEADYARKRAQELADFERDQAERLADHNSAIAEARADAAAREREIATETREESQEAWKDYYRTLRDLEREHTSRVIDLVATRDAIGLAEENRRYQQERADAAQTLEDKLSDIKESAAQERAEARAQAEQRIAEMEAEFQKEQAQRRAEFELEQQRADEEHKIEMQRRKADFEAELKERDSEHAIETQRRAEEFQRELMQAEEAHNRQMDELRQAYEEERRTRQEQLRRTMQELYNIERAGYDQMEAAAKAYVDALLREADRLEGQSPLGQRDIGGYVSSGLWRMHDNEFVMNAASTRRAERMLGGRLTQGSLMRALTSGASTYNINMPAGTLTGAVRQGMRDAARGVFADEMSGILEGLL